jgi:hypothetical protein
LGISRVSPEQAIDGWRYFGYAPPDGMTDADIARRHTDVLLEVPRGEGIAKSATDISKLSWPLAHRVPKST